MKKILIGVLVIGVIAWICTPSTTDQVSTTDVPTIDTTVLSGPIINWVYDDIVDDMDNSTTKIASIKSDNTITFEWPYEDNTFQLNIRKKKSSIDIYIRCTKCHFLTSISNDKTYRLKFDDRAPINVYANGSSSGDTDLVFLGSVTKVIDLLKKSSKLIVEAEFYNDGLRRIEFTTTGLEW